MLMIESYLQRELLLLFVSVDVVAVEGEAALGEELPEDLDLLIYGH